jgi:hypothetical protein
MLWQKKLRQSKIIITMRSLTSKARERQTIDTAKDTSSNCFFLIKELRKVPNIIPTTPET